MRAFLRQPLEKLTALAAIAEADPARAAVIVNGIRGFALILLNQAAAGNERAEVERLLALISHAAILPPPSITSITSDLGDTTGGILVTIAGAYLQYTTSVTFGGLAATIVSATATQLDVLTPAHAAGNVAVVVTTPAGSDSTAYEYWNPIQIAGTSIFDSKRGVTSAGGLVSQWNDVGVGNNVTQAAAGLKPTIYADHFGPEAAPTPGLFAIGTSGGGASGSLLDRAKVALATGKTYFFITKTKDTRVTGGTQGNVPNSVVGDDNVGGWSGNAGFGGQGGDLEGGEVSMINWNDSLGNFQRMTWDGKINDGQPHMVLITHSQVAPYPAEAYVNGTRITSGRISLGPAYAPVVAQATPFLSDYNALQLGWNALLGGKAANDDFFNGELACCVIVPSVVSATDRVKLEKWGYSKFMQSYLAWSTIVDPAPWSSRDGAGLVYMNGVFYLLGGWDPTTRNDIYRSDANGENWILIRADDQTPPQTGPNAMWTPRHSEPCFVHTINGVDYMYVVGGDYTAYVHDVWRSTDGITWEAMTLAAAWPARANQMAGSLNGKLYLFGGQTDYNTAASALNDVWESTDGGATWTQLANAPWAARGIGAVVTFNGKLWMMCGGRVDANPANFVEYNDVWSFDGTTWTQEVVAGPFAGRHYTNGFVLDGKIWFGDGATSAGNVLDLWKSSDGINWVEHNYNLWGARHADSWAAAPTFAIHCAGKAGDVGDLQVHKLAPISLTL